MKIEESRQSAAQYQNFVVESIAGASVFRCPDAFSVRHTVFFTWDQADRVWVYSGDVGAFYWQLEENGEWVKGTYRGPPPDPPQVFKELRPKWFP
jgi:hypothetical protein